MTHYQYLLLMNTPIIVKNPCRFVNIVFNDSANSHSSKVQYQVEILDDLIKIGRISEVKKINLTQMLKSPDHENYELAVTLISMI